MQNEKFEHIYSFYGNLKDGGEILSLNDIDIAIGFESYEQARVQRV